MASGLGAGLIASILEHMRLVGVVLLTYKPKTVAEVRLPSLK